MSDSIHIKQQTNLAGTVLNLPSSKSLSNRVLLIDAIMGGGSRLANLSSSNDTRLMTALLHTTNQVIDARDAGTVLRFLTAYYAVTGQVRTITGTTRMQKRPIGELVTALRTMGARIDYGSANGYPPLKLLGFAGQQVKSLSLRGDISSQFISALMMVAPLLPHGLALHLAGKISSRPYLIMTAEIMSHFGVRPEMHEATITIPSGSYRPAAYSVEPDWSAASYWFAFAALAKKSEILLPGVSKSALQGDRVIVDIMSRLGVTSDFRPDGLLLTGGGPRVEELELDFSDCPDLVQTVLPVCAALGVRGQFTGLSSLRIKETDRILALQQELKKVGATLEDHVDSWILSPGTKDQVSKKLLINTYDDHRMAMGFAAWSTMTEIEIENPDVVKKSYPEFWVDVKSLVM